MIDLEHDRPIGILGRAVQEGKSCLVADVSKDSDYIMVNPETRSELAVPIKLGEDVIGVIAVEHSELGAFDWEVAQALEALADQAAIAIRNARTLAELEHQYNNLKQIKGMVGSNTALHWMEMVSAVWGHSIKREVGKALNSAELVRHAYEKGNHPKALKELEDLYRIVEEIKEIPITAPLSAEDEVSSVRINRIVQGYLQNRWKHPQYKSIELYTELQPDLDSWGTVRASEAWVRRGLEIVVENAVQAMLEADSSPKRLSVITNLVDNKVKILITDTGPGIPLEIQELIFKDPIEKPIGSKGAGVGCALAGNIFEAYQGGIRVQETGPSGTVIEILLPIEQNMQ